MTAGADALSQLVEALFDERTAALAVRGPVLVVAAHADDETIGATWLMRRAPRLAVVHVTDGAPHDPRLWPASAPPSREAYAALRRREAEAALALVGVAPARIHELGVADQAAIEALVPITRALAATLASVAPALVVTHPYEGGHPDHDATAFATRAALALRAREGGLRARLVEMSSYHRHDGTLRTGRFLPPVEGEQVRVLSDEERALKAQMFACYASQRAVLGDFRIDEERYRAAAPASFEAAPHQGSLHYEALGFAEGAHFRVQARAAIEALDLSARALDEVTETR